jgi:hypothetical protein
LDLHEPLSGDSDKLTFKHAVCSGGIGQMEVFYCFCVAECKVAAPMLNEERSAWEGTVQLRQRW